MRILSYLRELNDALTDWENYQSISVEELRENRDYEVYGVLQNDLRTLKDFMKCVKELQREEL